MNLDVLSKARFDIHRIAEVLTGSVTLAGSATIRAWGLHTKPGSTRREA